METKNQQETEFGLPPARTSSRSRRKSTCSISTPSNTRSRRGKAANEPSEEELSELYRNKNYQAPPERKYETIFEAEAAGKKRGATEELVLGKNKNKRLLPPQKFWLEDKVKTRHRSRMTAKAFKGREKFTLTALTDEQEKSLQELIQKADEPIDDAENQTPNVARSRTSSVKSYRNNDTPEKKTNTPKAKASKITASESITPVDIYSMNMSKEEIRRKIEEADSYFGVVMPEQSDEQDTSEDSLPQNDQIHKTRRNSVTLKVRRSSRFLKNSSLSEATGSVYQMEEIITAKLPKKARRDSSLMDPVL